jgi:lysylphosphatidylglycerol synthetase-like protein (DUF2156 family)
MASIRNLEFVMKINGSDVFLYTAIHIVILAAILIAILSYTHSYPRSYPYSFPLGSYPLGNPHSFLVSILATISPIFIVSLVYYFERS